MPDKMAQVDSNLKPQLKVHGSKNKVKDGRDFSCHQNL